MVRSCRPHRPHGHVAAISVASTTSNRCPACRRYRNRLDSSGNEGAEPSLRVRDHPATLHSLRLLHDIDMTSMLDPKLSFGLSGRSATQREMLREDAFLQLDLDAGSSAGCSFGRVKLNSPIAASKPLTRITEPRLARGTRQLAVVTPARREERRRIAQVIPLSHSDPCRPPGAKHISEAEAGKRRRGAIRRRERGEGNAQRRHVRLFRRGSSAPRTSPSWHFLTKPCSSSYCRSRKSAKAGGDGR